MIGGGGRGKESYFRIRAWLTDSDFPSPNALEWRVRSSVYIKKEGAQSDDPILYTPPVNAIGFVCVCLCAPACLLLFSHFIFLFSLCWETVSRWHSSTAGKAKVLTFLFCPAPPNNDLWSFAFLSGATKKSQQTTLLGRYKDFPKKEESARVFFCVWLSLTSTERKILWVLVVGRLWKP